MPEAFKKYVLMHKEVAVAGVELDEATGLITAVYDVSNAAHLPLGVSGRTEHRHTAKTSGKMPGPQPVRPILDLAKGQRPVLESGQFL